MNPALILKLAALLSAFTAITIEDLAEIRAESTLGPDIAKNIENFQNFVQSMDQATIDFLNQARTADGESAV